MKSTWVECVLNGAWQGTYQFCEHIRIAKERVNVHDWEGDAGDIAEAFAKEHALTSAQGDPNCVAFIAYDSSGDVVARNYALVTQAPSESTTIILR